MKIKNIHTDTVSPYLLFFIQEAIAPNSLESIFLQEAPEYDSVVDVERIYRHVLRRHRLSLKKVLILSCVGNDVTTTRPRKWMIPRNILSFIISGRMPQVRELGMVIDSRDWVSSCLLALVGLSTKFSLLISVS